MLRIYDVVIEVLRELRPFVERLRRVDADLANQMTRALTSIALNLAEGSGSKGRLRALRYSNSCGSAKEANACIESSVALHGLEAPSSSTLEKLDHVISVLTIVSR